MPQTQRQQKYMNIQTITLGTMIVVVIAIVGFMWNLDSHIDKRIKQSRSTIEFRVLAAEGKQKDNEKKFDEQTEIIHELDKKVDSIKKDVQYNKELIKEVLREVKKR